MSTDDTSEVDEELLVQGYRNQGHDRRRKKRLKRLQDTAKEHIKIMTGEISGDPNDPLHQKKLDPDQKKFATSEIDRHLICSAGPGSGKTFSLVSRIAFIISKGVEPDKILVITYTRKARQEFEELYNKIFGDLGKVYGERPRFLTFHRFANEYLVSKYNSQHVEGKTLTYIEESEINKEVEQIKKTLDLNIQTSDIKKIIKIARYNLSQDKDIKKLSDISRRIYLPYKQFLDSKQTDTETAVDYMGLLLLLNKDLDTQFLQDFKYLLVDEAQDTDELMFSIISKLSPYLRGVTSVGDVWQKIHAYSGLVISDFVSRFSGLHSHPINIAFTTNYRSHKSIQLGVSSLRSGSPLITISPNFEYRIFHLTSFCRRFTVHEQYDILISIIPTLLKLEKTIYLLFRKNNEIKSFRNYIKKRNKELNTKTKKKNESENQEERKNHFQWIDSPRLTLSVCHQIKGGEADIVFLGNAFEMNIPLYREFDANPKDNPFNQTIDQKLGEEKNLFYVTISRPKEVLVILSPTTVHSDLTAFASWAIKHTFPSSFIKLLGRCVRKVYPSTKDPRNATSINLEKSFREKFLEKYIALESVKLENKREEEEKRKKRMEDE